MLLRAARLLVRGHLVRLVRRRCVCDPIGDRRSRRRRPAAIPPATAAAAPPATVTSSASANAAVAPRGLPRGPAAPVNAPAGMLPRRPVGRCAVTAARMRAPASAPTIARRAAQLSPTAAAAASANSLQILIFLLRSGNGIA